MSVADFNNDGQDDIFISDGGYDERGREVSYPILMFYSSLNGFFVEEITERRKTHGSDAADLNGDGFVDIILGRGRTGKFANSWDSSRYLLNQQGKGFVDADVLLPSSLQRKTSNQPVYIALLDVDKDGHVDIVSGMSCGIASKVFWNDGHGAFSDDRFTAIPLEYPQSPSCPDTVYPTTVAQAFIVSEELTNANYLGIWAGVSWKGRYLTLHEVDGRLLSQNIANTPNEDIQAEYGDFAYAINIEEKPNGHTIDLYDFSFKRTKLVFDPESLRYESEMVNAQQTIAYSMTWKA